MDDEEFDVADNPCVSLSHHADAETDELSTSLCSPGEIRANLRIAPYLFVQ
jgi:hypothetical protein